MVALRGEGRASRDDTRKLVEAEKIFFSRKIRDRADLTERQTRLARFVSDDVIPRLVKLHERIARDASPSEGSGEQPPPTDGDIDDFAELLLGDDLEAAITYISALRDKGLSIETVYLELFAPTARLLGELWERDECDFIDVTIGVGRLQHLLSVFSRSYGLPDLATKRDVLVALAPGNQHSLGASILEEFFAAAGWRVRSEHSGERMPIIAQIRERSFSLLGLSVGSDGQLRSLKRLIAEVRQKSMNQRVSIMVGGPIFRDRPELCEHVGADATCANAPSAVLAAQRLLEVQLQDARERNTQPK